MVDFVYQQCDEGRPECMRCLRLNRRCGGYEHDGLVIVVDQTQRTIERASRCNKKRTSRSIICSSQDQEQHVPNQSLQTDIQDPSNTKEARILVFLLSNMSLSISAQDAVGPSHRIKTAPNGY